MAQDLTSADGLGKLLLSVPELRKLLATAQESNWSLTKFQDEVENSKWYKTHSATARAVLIQQANDPATYNDRIKAVQQSLQQLAKQTGFRYTDLIGSTVAANALLTGNDTNQQWLTGQLGKYQNYKNLPDKGYEDLQGGMAAAAQQLQQLASDYGYNWSPKQIAQYAQSVVSGETTMDTYKQMQVNWAKSAFPGLAEEIQHGATVRDLANPYIQSMSSVLEVNPGSIDVFTPTIRRALQGTQDPNTKARTVTPLWQFEQQLRADPRWQYTSNAKNTISNALVHIGRDFGFGL